MSWKIENTKWLLTIFASLLDFNKCKQVAVAEGQNFVHKRRYDGLLVSPTKNNLIDNRDDLFLQVVFLFHLLNK